MIDKEQIKHVASLAKLEIKETDFEAFAEKFEHIIEMEDQLSAIDTEGVEPTTHLSTRNTVFRADEPVKTQTREELFKNVPETEKGLIKVPSIIEEGDN